MLLRLAALGVLAVPLGLGSAGLAKEPADSTARSSTAKSPTAKSPPSGGKPAAPAAKSSASPAARPAAKPSFEVREPPGSPSPGKQRQKACIAEWRALSTPEKTAQGPGWPQFYSKCVKRLKGAQKD